MSHRPRARESAQHDDEHLPTHRPAGDRASHHMRITSCVPPGSLDHDARGSPADPDHRSGASRARAATGGVPSPPAAGSMNAEHEAASPGASRAGGWTGNPASGRRARPIRREDVHRTHAWRRRCQRRTRGSRRAVSRCARCEDTGRTCNACVQRRHRAWKLVDRDGRTIDEAAAVLPPARRHRARAGRARARPARVADYRINSIPTARARAFLEREMERDPSLTRAEVAHRMNMSPADFDRQLGYAAAKRTNGAKQQRVGIPLASNLTLALGRATRARRLLTIKLTGPRASRLTNPPPSAPVRLGRASAGSQSVQRRAGRRRRARPGRGRESRLRARGPVPALGRAVAGRRSP